MPCLAPVLLLGYLLTLYPNHAHVTTVNAPTIEMQTCEREWGLHAKASTSGLYSFGLHYGLTQEWGDWRLTFQPRAGLSYADPSVYELPQRKQFEVGGQILAGFQQFRFGLTYWHLSNAGMMSPNIGLDMLVIETGWAF